MRGLSPQATEGVLPSQSASLTASLPLLSRCARHFPLTEGIGPQRGSQETGDAPHLLASPLGRGGTAAGGDGEGTPSGASCHLPLRGRLLVILLSLGPLFEGAVAAGDWGSLPLCEGGELRVGEETGEVWHGITSRIRSRIILLIQRNF